MSVELFLGGMVCMILSAGIIVLLTRNGTRPFADHETRDRDWKPPAHDRKQKPSR